MAVRCCEADLEQRQAIVDRARAWIGTPYRHQASARGVGADCLGLVRGVWRELHGTEPEETPTYSDSWADFSKEERLLDAASRHLCPIDLERSGVGDVLLFRMKDGNVAKHIAILVTPQAYQGRIIHAYSGHTVCETSVALGWYRRLAGAFRFPNWGM